jgi:hypothetical protein
MKKRPLTKISDEFAFPSDDAAPVVEDPTERADAPYGTTTIGEYTFTPYDAHGLFVEIRRVSKYAPSQNSVAQYPISVLMQWAARAIMRTFGGGGK